MRKEENKAKSNDVPTVAPKPQTLVAQKRLVNS
jgi:hypothetical protein